MADTPTNGYPREPHSDWPAAPAVQASDAQISGVRVLLAEDHRELHRAMRQFLEDAGASVESAYDGREAVAKALSSTFDIVLMDLRMAHMDGLEATRTLRLHGCALPIVAITADLAALRLPEAQGAGCNGCLTKPFKIRDLVACLPGRKPS
jgi:CheY-like chemotaxis protein